MAGMCASLQHDAYERAGHAWLARENEVIASGFTVHCSVYRNRKRAWCMGRGSGNRGRRHAPGQSELSAGMTCTDIVPVVGRAVASAVQDVVALSGMPRRSAPRMPNGSAGGLLRCALASCSVAAAIASMHVAIADPACTMAERKSGMCQARYGTCATRTMTNQSGLR